MIFYLPVREIGLVLLPIKLVFADDLVSLLQDPMTLDLLLVGPLVILPIEGCCFALVGLAVC